MRRVMAGAYRVDVVLLHQQHVGQHRRFVNGATRVRVELMPIHAAEQHPPAIDGQHPSAISTVRNPIRVVTVSSAC